MTHVARQKLRAIPAHLPHYTYLHRRASDGRYFYVGKGSRGRAWSSDGRSEHWWRVKKKHGIEVEIACCWLDAESAMQHETVLIACLRDMGHPLVNATDGGEGCRGTKRTSEQVEAMRRRMMAWASSPAGVEARERSSKKMKELARDPAYAEKMTAAMRSWHLSDGNKEKAAAHLAAAMAASRSEAAGIKRTETMRRIEAETGASRERMRRIMSDPERKRRLLAAAHAHWASEESRSSVSKRMREYYADEGNRAELSRRAIERMSSADTRASLARSRGGRPFLHIESGAVYQTQGDAARALGIRQSSVSQVLSGRNRTASGNSFTYKLDFLLRTQPSVGTFEGAIKEKA